MRRRGNKSSKVPNVKLRPAQAGAVSQLLRADDSVCWAGDSQAGSDDTSVFDSCPRPFKGVVVCATGVVDKPTLFKQALELGATLVSAFTNRVTHLVAVDHGGAKYMCALERKIPILKPSWLTESYQIWLRGDDVDLHKSVKSHRLPIFSGVILCPSGITDITRRTQINKILTGEQGVYMKNLERPVKVTHLLCSGDEETDKMRYAEKFNKKGEASVHLVWEEWFWDSLEFGGRFDEAKYQVRCPRPERKSIPESASLPPPSSALPSERGEDSVPSNLNLPTPTYQDDAEELAAVKRLPAVTLQLWESLLKPRGYEITDGELQRGPSESQVSPKPQPSPAGGLEGKADSVISAFRRANSFAPVQKDPNLAIRPQPFRRSHMTILPNLDGDATGSIITQVPQQAPNMSRGSPSLFFGMTFRALGEARSLSVRNAIEQNGGKMAVDGDSDGTVDYIVVRLVSGSKLYRGDTDEVQRAKYRTECWLEQCIFEGRLCLPHDHISFSPLTIETPVPGTESIALSFSGLDQSESCWVTRLLRAVGISLAPVFSRRSTHLLCPSRMGAKFDKAQEWGIPVVTMEWLRTVATSGVVPAASQYLVVENGTHSPVFAEAIQQDHLGGEIQAESNRRVDKGKGREQVRECEAPHRMAEKSTTKRSDAPKPNIPGSPRSKHEHPPERRNPTSPLRPPDVALFGLPNWTLGQAQQENNMSSSTPPHSRPGAKPEYASHQIPLPASTPTNSDVEPIRNPTPLEIERERHQVLIPSSKSPSPMKIPRRPNRIQISPAKISNEATKALQESITSLLGKRQSSEDDENIPARGAKRVRPQRTKPQSRQPSDFQLSEISAVPVSAYTGSMGPFEPYEELNILESNTAEESMRVRYEDPGQRDEKRRLMNLLKGDSHSDGSASGGETKSAAKQPVGARTRRSTRVAGF